jgi:hypothetical protein
VGRPPANSVTRIDMKCIPYIITKHRPAAALVQNIFLTGRGDNQGLRACIRQ